MSKIRHLFYHTDSLTYMCQEMVTKGWGDGWDLWHLWRKIAISMQSSAREDLEPLFCISPHSPSHLTFRHFKHVCKTMIPRRPARSRMRRCAKYVYSGTSNRVMSLLLSSRQILVQIQHTAVQSQCALNVSKQQITTKEWERRILQRTIEETWICTRAWAKCECGPPSPGDLATSPCSGSWWYHVWLWRRILDRRRRS